MDITALIVDDEPLARSLMHRLLKAQGISVVGEAADGDNALRMALELQPDLLFLDIQMPGISGLQIAEQMSAVPGAPLIVFVTGYSEHAPAAFELDSLDYLLKPVSKSRLVQTITRARARLQNSNPQILKANNAPLTHRRLAIRDDYMVHFIRLTDIIFAEARDRRVCVHTSDGEYKTWYTLKQLEEQLPEELFFRIHDGYIVQVEMIEDLHFLGNHAYEVRLSNQRRIPVGRSRYPVLQRRLGLA